MMNASDGNNDWMFAAEEKLKEHEERMKLNQDANFPTSANNNEPEMEDQNFCVRVPDDDEIFEHDEVYDDSPYIHQAKRNRDIRLSALTDEQKSFAKNVFSGFLIFSIALSSFFVYGNSVFPDKNSLYFFEMGFDVDLPQDLSDAYLEWDATLNLKETTPVFWNVPLSGGDIVEEIVASCLKLVQANEVGGLVQEGWSKKLDVVQVFGDSYVNVDTTTTNGLIHASSLGLAQSGLADVIFTPMVYQPAKLFLPTNGEEQTDYGYMFTILRHPVERAVHMFYYLKDATWDPLYKDDLKQMTIEEYAHSSYVESNWLTRMLSNQPGGTLTEDHVLLAKEILRRKFLVGNFQDMKFSMKRFEKRFGWYAADEDTEACEQAIIADKMSKYNDVPMISENSDTWEVLVERNKYDMDVYEFASMLFMNQKSKSN